MMWCGEHGCSARVRHVCWGTLRVPSWVQSTILPKSTVSRLLRGTLRSSLRSPAQVEGTQGQVVSTAIEDMDFTDAFTNAVEAKQVAAQNKLQAEIEQARKIMEQEAAAQMAVIQAEAAAQVAKTEADAKAYAGQKEAEANAALEKSITQELLDYYYILQWNGELPDTYVGSDDVSTIVNGVGGN